MLPEGLSLNICISRRSTGSDENYLKEALISSRGNRAEKIIPGMHAYDASYTELTCEWQGSTFKIESAVSGPDIYLLVTPIKMAEVTPVVVLEVGMLWNRAGEVNLNGSTIDVELPTKKITVRSTNPLIEDQLPTTSKYMVALLDEPVSFYTSQSVKTIDEVKGQISNNREALLRTYDKYGSLAETYKAMQGVLAWNIIYDASNDRVIYPVSRIWNKNFGGHFVLFDWDTYFSAYMVSMENKELAYANAVEITKSITPQGFIPNFASSYGVTSYDRSQPPVGSLIFKELYRRYQDRWLLEYVYDDLLKWNRWWISNRVQQDLLCWGSNKVSPPYTSDFATNKWQGAAYESGLDNSPMFDDIPFNAEKGMLELADVGLTSLYIMDCNALSEIATILGKKADADELTKRARQFTESSQKLWDEQSGIFKNKRTDDGSFSPRLSPTNFYAFLAKSPSVIQAKRMEKEHLLNENEFNGKWVLPSIAINDPAFKDQDYWRGRIWAPMNFLVYLGILNYDLPEGRKMLVDKSLDLFMENVRINGWIFENYDGITGNITNQENGRSMGDNYYHWGALLGFISFIENGFVENPMKPLIN